MEEIVIKKQRQMTLPETFDFCLSSIRHRFMRSLLTLSVVILAVAFFMFLQCTNIFRNSVTGGVEQQILKHRKPLRMLNMLYAKTCTEPDFNMMLVEARKLEGESERLQKALGLSADEMNQLIDNAFSEMTYLTFFDGLKIGVKKELFLCTAKKPEGKQADDWKCPKCGFGEDKCGKLLLAGDRLDFLTDPEKLEQTLEKMREMGGIQIPRGNDLFREFLKNYKNYDNKRKAAIKKWNELRDSLKEEGKDLSDSKTLRRHLLSLDTQGKKAWQEKLAKGNYILTDAEVEEVLTYLNATDKIELIQEVLSKEEYRKRWRRVYQNQYSKMDEKMSVLDSGKTARVFQDGNGNYDAAYPCPNPNCAIVKAGFTAKTKQLTEARAQAEKALAEAKKGTDKDAIAKAEADFNAKDALVKKDAEETAKRQKAADRCDECDTQLKMITEEDLRFTAKEFDDRQTMRDLEKSLEIDILKDAVELTPEQIYLMCLSFLVCVVGITNAMLMSITERFREIATLKCLGATDSFILVQIVLEALIQGVIGALAGLLLGFIVALIATTFKVGAWVFQTFNWSSIGYAALYSLLAGILLSVISSLFPSTKAARMAPMEAMRVE